MDGDALTCGVGSQDVQACIAPAVPGGEPRPEVLVAGLQWDTGSQGAGADLDLTCVLLGPDGRLLDAVTPSRPRNENASVVHTGDSTTGAGAWDDERVFIFLDEIPPSVTTIMLVVACAAGQPIGIVPNASCHISDHETDRPLLHVPLSRVAAQPVHCIATLSRTGAGWQVAPGCPDDVDASEILQRVRMSSSNKAQTIARTHA